MTLAEERLRQLDSHSLTADERVLLRCGVAAEFIHAGQYEAAREALGELWRGVGERPEVEGMPPEVAAEVLLQCGALTGLHGGELNIPGAQERAKDLLTEAAREFRSQGNYRKASEAECELGACYWRLGAHDDARVIMREALEPLTESDVELKAKIHVRRTLVEFSENRYYEVLNILREAEAVFESANDSLKGRWHGQKALVLEMLAEAERNPGHFDRAILEYTAAIYHYERAKHERYCARNLNNLAMVFYKVSRYREAHEQLDRAQVIFTSLKDAGSLAQVDETRARVLVAEGKYREANRILAPAVRTFEQGGESALLADALTLQGVVWARLGDNDASAAVLPRAADMAERLGARNNAGLAVLTFIEEHAERRAIPAEEIYEAYRRADGLLKDTQDAADVARLRACAQPVMRRLAGLRLRDKDFTFYGAVHEVEARLIEDALEEAGGSLVRAARLLGLKHQTLASMLQTRHRELMSKRTPKGKRLRSIIKEPKE
ncbi:MAG TPA: helix-turn-helix domain-containing protein [Pyrinomonadaceae bacterium]|nr:helix-turn-helix domain-containing protein [Pyrinomonadaceae bacterium]